MPSDVLIPRPYLIMQDIQSISACIHRNAAIDRNFNLWTWGAASMAQTDDGLYSNDIPQDIEAAPKKIMENALMVSCGGWHTLCITRDKKLWAWGENEFGQLGTGDLKKREAPTLIMDDVLFVCANEYQSFAITEDKTLWGWGDNESGTLFGKEKCYQTPRVLMDSVSSVSCGNEILAVVKQDRTLWAWGNNTQKTIFTEAQYQKVLPSKIMEKIDSLSLPVSENSDFGLAVSMNADLYLFGGTQYGSMINTQIRKAPGGNPIKVMCGVSNAYAGNDFIFIKDQRERLFSLGRNDLGQCGNGKSTLALKKPELIMTHVLQAACGHHHGMGLQTNGDLWIWGGDYGMLNQT